MTTENTKTILVAEDERPMAKAMSLKLTKAGYQVTVAYNGQEALDFLKDATFDLIITDLMMPRVDGFEILEHLKQKGITTPVIVTSNLSQEEDRAKAREMGAQEYFVKSNTPIIQIVDYVNNVLS